MNSLPDRLRDVSAACSSIAACPLLKVQFSDVQKLWLAHAKACEEAAMFIELASPLLESVPATMKIEFEPPTAESPSESQSR